MQIPGVDINRIRSAVRTRTEKRAPGLESYIVVIESWLGGANLRTPESNLGGFLLALLSPSFCIGVSGPAKNKKRKCSRLFFTGVMWLFFYFRLIFRSLGDRSGGNFRAF
jgi:hypothetical protein